MRPHLALIVLTMCLPMAGRADPQAPRMITLSEAPQWHAVGRLNIAGNRLCTATLIAPDQVITAAHCLFHPITHHRADPGEIRFVAGFRQDTYAALVGVTATAILPGYTYTGNRADLATIANDLALLQLSRPVLPTEAEPLTVTPWPTAPLLDIVGYGRDRPQIASIRQGCTALSNQGGAWLLDCPVLPGLSGAPVLLSGGQAVVGVVSASVGPAVAGVQALVVPLAPHLAELRARLTP